MRVHNLPPYVYADRDRHGKVRYYFKRRGSAKFRIRDKPGSDGFRRVYAAAMGGQLGPAPAPVSSATGSLEWLCKEYFNSAEFLGWEKSTQTTKRHVLAQVWREPLDAGKPGGPCFGGMPVAEMPPKALRVLRDRWAHKPGHANNALSMLGALFTWAIEAEYMSVNPARDIKRLKVDSAGYHTWTEDELAAYEARHPIGTQARLAFDLLALTGCRRSDVVLFGPQHIVASDQGPRVVFRAKKNHFNVDMPLQPELADSIAAAKTGADRFLVNLRGKPWLMGSFSHRFKEWCCEAGLPHCSAHGIRKAGAVAAAEGGSTDAELMALFGWSSNRQALHYRKKANNAKMATKSGAFLRRRGKDNKNDGGE